MMLSKLKVCSIAMLIGLMSVNSAARAETLEQSPDRKLALSSVDTAELHEIMKLLQTLPLQIQSKQQKPRVAVIYDGSRSMLSSMSASNPVPKSEVVARAFGNVMPLLMRNADVDVLRFGGEAQGKCWPQHAYSTRNGEVRVPSPQELQAWQAQASSPSSQGSPLWLSIQAAAEIMRADGEAGGSIVLISDGRDQCPDTPTNMCEQMQNLAEEGFTVHVLSVNATRADQPGLQCLAENTGGIFANADDPVSVGTLLSILTRVALAESSASRVAGVLANLMTQMDGQTGKAAEIERQLGQVIRAINDANQNLSDIQRDLASHVDHDLSVVQIATTINELTDKIEALNGELSESRQLIAALQVRLDEANQTIGDRDQSIRDLHQEVLRMRGVSDRFHKSLGKKTEQIKEMMVRLAQQDQALRDLYAERQNLVDKIGVLEASLVEQVASSTARADQLQNQCTQTVKDLEAHNQQHTSELDGALGTCKAQLKEINTAAASDIEALQTAIEALRVEAGILAEKLAKARSERERYKRKFNEEQGKHSALLTTLADLQADRESLKARISALEAQNGTMGESLMRCEAKLQSAIGQQGGFNAALESCQSEKDQLRDALTKTQSELGSVKAELAAANRALDDAHKGNQALQLSLYHSQAEARAGAERIVALEAKIIEQEGVIARLEDVLKTMKACRHDFTERRNGKSEGSSRGQHREFKQYHEGTDAQDGDPEGHGKSKDRSLNHQQCGSAHQYEGDKDRYSMLQAPDTILDLGPDVRGPAPVKRTSSTDIIEHLKELGSKSFEITL